MGASGEKCCCDGDCCCAPPPSGAMNFASGCRCCSCACACACCAACAAWLTVNPCSCIMNASSKLRLRCREGRRAERGEWRMLKGEGPGPPARGDVGERCDAAAAGCGDDCECKYACPCAAACCCWVR